MWPLIPAAMTGTAALASWLTWRDLGRCYARRYTPWRTIGRILWWPAGLTLTWALILLQAPPNMPAAVTAACTTITAILAVTVVTLGVTSWWVAPRRRITPWLLLPAWAIAAFNTAIVAGYPSALRGNPAEYFNGTGPLTGPLIAGSWAGLLILGLGIAHIRWITRTRQRNTTTTPTRPQRDRTTQRTGR